MAWERDGDAQVQNDGEAPFKDRPLEESLSAERIQLHFSLICVFTGLILRSLFLH